ncbi:MAG: alpha/beta fold hydrolase [Bullifex sp.]
MEEFISGQNYSVTMEEKIIPYLASVSERVDITSPVDGHKTVSEHFPLKDSKAAVVVLHGFTEGILKYSEAVYTFLSHGYEVYIIEHYGHGRSDRDGEVKDDPSKVSVKDFDTYVDDVLELVKKIRTKPLYLFGHSMGGGIAIRFLEEHPGLFDKAVLSAPMTGMNMGGVPVPLAKILSSLMCAIGKGSSYVIGHHAFADDGDFEHSPDKSRERWNFFEKIKRENECYRSNGATWNWLKSSLKATSLMMRKSETERIDCPVLLLQAESDHSVDKPSQVKFASLNERIIIKEIKGSKHEIMFSCDDVNMVFWNEVFSFLT